MVSAIVLIVLAFVTHFELANLFKGLLRVYLHLVGVMYVCMYVCAVCSLTSYLESHPSIYDEY